jgi:hypothetical protein
MSVSDFINADRRLTMLQLMQQDEGHSNEKILERSLIAMGEVRGVVPGYVRAQLEFLEKARCVTLENFRDQLLTAALTPTGRAVLRGSMSIDGISKPE